MNSSFWFQVLVNSAIALLPLGAIAAPPDTETTVETTVETTFICETHDGVPATIARTTEGEIPMMLWNSAYLGESSSTPQQLCEQVSERLETYYTTGQLNYITTGRVDGQNVACVADMDGGDCLETLFSLNAEMKPRTALQQTFRIRVPSTGPIGETDPFVYIDLEKLLDGEYPSIIPVEEGDASSSESTP